MFIDRSPQIALPQAALATFLDRRRMTGVARFIDFVSLQASPSRPDITARSRHR